MKKVSGAGTWLELVQNPDIIAAVAQRNARALIVGFAAETQDTLANARAKLTRKGLDMIVLNDVSDRRIGFDSNDNAVTVITHDHEERIEMTSKADIARLLVSHIATALTRPRTRREPAVKTGGSGSAAG
jgi:phosphopantothenoylcysteine decarboxylase / phosphopantothenate---cysteine ligase